MRHILIAASITLAWVASVVFLPFLTHHAEHLIITANAAALGADTPTWLIEFAEFIGSWCLGFVLVTGGCAATAWAWFFQDRGGR